MFTPLELDLERGWPGRIDGDRVIQVAAQTIEAFFTGGGTAREHAEYPLEGVRLRAPVLRPPSIRIFESSDFYFTNTASIYGPDDEIPFPDGAEYIDSEVRPAAVIGAGERIGGFTILNDWVAAGLEGAKSRDFAVSLGPVVVTPDEFVPPGVPWDALVDHARQNTRLLSGDVLAAEATRSGHALGPGDAVELEVDGIGVLRNSFAERSLERRDGRT